MRETIRNAKTNQDTVGGIIEVRAYNLPPGLGSCARWQDKLDGRLMRAVGSIQAIKGVEIGLGFESARRPGSAVHDPIHYDRAQRNTPNLGFTRPTNRAGGLEGGMTNGQPVIIRAAMKPIATLLQGMDSVDLKTLRPERSDYERSDVCALPAASVVAENVVAFELAAAICEKFPTDTLTELRAAHAHYMKAIRDLA
jgi:chorismate synthase